MAKMERLPFETTRKRAVRPLELIHSDTMGPVKPISWPGQKRYILTLIDDFSRFAKSYLLKTKDKSGDALEKFLVTTRNLLGKDEKVCYIRSDQGTEFTGGKFMEIMKRENIEPDYLPPATPQHNGVAERLNQIIKGKIRAFMCDSGIPPTMWEFAAEAAVQAYNVTPHKSINYQVPIIKFASNARCNFDQLRRLGCIAYVKLPKIESKFKAVAIKTILVGYLPTGYLLWHPSSRKFIESKHVKFLEKLTYKDVYIKERICTDQSNAKPQQEEFAVIRENENATQSENLETEKTKHKKRGRPRKENKEKIEQKKKDKVSPITRSKSKRKLESEEQINHEITARRVHDISFLNGHTDFTELDKLAHVWISKVQKDPSNYNEAMNSSEKEFWKSAVKEELASMESNKVWKLVERPKPTANGKKPNIIDAIWVFKKKVDADGLVKHKARLVGRGYKDKNEYDLRETYAPVSRLSLIRASLSVINKLDLHVCQMDVKTAFLNGELEDEIFMEIPDGLEVHSETRRTKVCKLEKSIYGLKKVSLKRWYEKFVKEAQKLGLTNDMHDPCLFTWRHNGKMVFVVLYVDDMLIASNDLEKLNEVKIRLSNVFEMKDLGEPKNFLGMTIQRNRSKREILIHQADYTERMLEKFNMEGSNPKDTPMETRQVSNRNKRRKSEKFEEKEG